MKGKVIAAIVIVLALLIVGVTAGMLMNSGSTNQTNLPDNTSNGNNNNGGNGSDGSGGTTGSSNWTVVSPSQINAADAKVELSVNYDGSNASGYEYVLANPYNLSITSKALSGWSGQVVVYIFAEQTNKICDACITIDYGDGNVVNWTYNWVNDQDTSRISGHSGIISLDNGSSSNVTAYHFTFGNVGIFNMTFQAFDAQTGEPLSVPVMIGGIHVPVTGTMNFTLLEDPSYNGTYFSVLLNVTNDLNIPNFVNASYLQLSNGTDTVGVVSNMMGFTSQDTNPGQSAQFLAVFKITGEQSKFTLIYDDPTIGGININIS